MNNSQRVFIIATVVLALAASPNEAGAVQKGSEPVSVRTDVDKTEAFIGDRITLSIDVSFRDPRIEIKLPDIGKTTGAFTVIDKKITRRERLFGGRHQILRSVLTAYEIGKHELQPVAVRYRTPGSDWTERSTEPVTIEIKSILSAAAGARDIRDIKNPLELPSYRWIFILLLSAALIGLAVFAIFRLITRASGSRRLIIRPAHEIAYETLEDIKRRGLIQQGRINEYYVLVSQCIRRYLENRFSIRAPEMTTEEFLVSVKDADLLSGEHKNLLKDFLSSCDMVKFARSHPGCDEAETSFQLAKRFIDQTKETIETEPGRFRQKDKR